MNTISYINSIMKLRSKGNIFYRDAKFNPTGLVHMLVKHLILGLQWGHRFCCPRLPILKSSTLWDNGRFLLPMCMSIFHGFLLIITLPLAGVSASIVASILQLLKIWESGLRMKRLILLRWALGVAERALSSLKNKPDSKKDNKMNDGGERSATSETDLSTVLNAWFSAGLYTGKYLTEQSCKKQCEIGFLVFSRKQKLLCPVYGKCK
ncbi:putative 4-diphosphocytidyl-2-C-methyl-D-erythritol kinase [Bienertia sinuspersici]